jgi:hypothetical protein
LLVEPVEEPPLEEPLLDEPLDPPLALRPSVPASPPLLESVDPLHAHSVTNTPIPKTARRMDLLFGFGLVYQMPAKA